ncbi:hypothetical protein Pmar_PMAR017727 [Perkinsus marinus ATCC 50983]|uniref:Uncharacterized protein n=1 Tax=Perkinsus marinus (strain ATCC 50983 / TXsc) TaxID=423536 RepID=C5L3U0_PERM5|nr:hypothetical protein Pmar_PMAR017727 [Perkinsus marinus ATCC 50983]EER08669.1 hypothetical protein Pmar_PMAR017727 [Perkinsus marinus ATCC 50983]|eukprot:XP_002776853.1 hypothetical protein Pmar_PMAR017727 [Perkinsus marinus ATCC 50983]
MATPVLYRKHLDHQKIHLMMRVEITPKKGLFDITYSGETAITTMILNAVLPALQSEGARVTGEDALRQDSILDPGALGSEVSLNAEGYHLLMQQVG